MTTIYTEEYDKLIEACSIQNYDKADYIVSSTKIDTIDLLTDFCRSDDYVSVRWFIDKFNISSDKDIEIILILAVSNHSTKILMWLFECVDIKLMNKALSIAEISYNDAAYKNIEGYKQVKSDEYNLMLEAACSRGDADYVKWFIEEYDNTININYKKAYAISKKFDNNDICQILLSYNRECYNGKI